MTHGSLFDGAGGMRIGLEQAGFVTRWTLDILNGDDIRTTDPDRYERVDLISGGPPCQRGSAVAYFQRTRTGFTLWPDMLRFVARLRPTWVLVENVVGFKPEMVGWSRELQCLGYGCAGQCISVKHWLPQLRTRVFIVARMGIDGMALWNLLYAAGIGAQAGNEGAPDARRREHKYRPCADCLRDGVPARIPGWKFALMGAGNAVAPPVANWLADRIQKAEALIV